MAGDWKQINDDREKYQAYLCSREWAVLKQAVHKRAGGICERCKLFPGNAVHHLTYKRKYKEEMEDLQLNCKHCHEFTHGKNDLDPAAIPWTMQKYFDICRRNNLSPAPIQVVAHLLDIKRYWLILSHAIDVLQGLQDIADYPVDLSDAADVLNIRMPFDLKYYKIWNRESWNCGEYETIRKLFGYREFEDAELIDSPEDSADE